ncbi:hypothetical protein M2152_000805 [Microbacteriaceae bacterium SG_E_30_P1]|uniref:SPW repeat-containing protein n=1 Tax=Antiquaquibacter oligotrophicus TaxID=2880260 RepID=A0ABT6KMG8_9MICO|nr:DUF6804 family protein [Antiquaquibacter oligotrophicus]MDH6180623.1 hypothetical protein [Antiquaquibacter oligotrophicus]UDF13645.1 hypothetical protein LH407_01990 [Antiquaquibacter oligotrophicus]
MSASYPDPARRVALAPALIAAVALLVGAAVVDAPGYVVVLFIVSIFALIVAVFAWQAKQWWWLVGLIPIAVLWNPVFPIDLGDPQLWRGLHFAAAAVFIAAGILIKITPPARER